MAGHPCRNQQPIVVDVAIVGGGPAGLAAAYALAKAGQTVKVYERMPELFPVGAAIGLGPNGMNCLHALGPELYGTVRKVCSESLHKSKIFTKEGVFKPTGGTDIGDFYEIAKQYGPEGGRGLVTVKWHKLRDTLAAMLPPGVLELDAAYSGHKEVPAGVAIDFANRPQVRARLLLGADGANSAVRRMALREAAPQFQGVVIWRGIVEEATLGDIKEGDDGSSSHMWTEGGRFGGFLRLFGNKGREAVWMCISPWEKAREEEVRRKPHGTETPEDQRTKLELCLETMKDFDEDFLRIVRGTDPSTIQQNPIYRRIPSVNWGSGRVSLLGDAAHLMPPNYGQGTSLALEDALTLASHILRHGPEPSSLRLYEAERIRRVLPIQLTIAFEAHRAWQKGGAEGLIKEGSMPPHMKAFMHRLFSYRPPQLAAGPAAAAAGGAGANGVKQRSDAGRIVSSFRAGCLLRRAQVLTTVAVLPQVVMHRLGLA